MVRTCSSIAAQRDTHIHHVIIYNERGPLRLRLVAQSYLANAAVPPKEIVQVLAGNVVIQILDEQNAVGACWKLSLEYTLMSFIR